MGTLRPSPKGLEKLQNAFDEKHKEKRKTCGKDYTYQEIGEKVYLDPRRVSALIRDGKSVEEANFRNICKELDLDWTEIAEQPSKQLVPQRERSSISGKREQSEGSGHNPMLSSPHTQIFLDLMEKKLERFVGRKYVTTAFEQFTAQYDRGYFLLMGEPGEGKSTIAAHYATTKSCLFYFNVRGDRQNTASLFLENICWQLIECYELDKPSALPPDATQQNAFLKKLLRDASQKTDKLVIVVDALDEVDLGAQSDYSSNVLYLPQNLPKGVYFFLTLRRDVEALKHRLVFDTYQESIKLEDFADSTKDIEDYIRKFLQDSVYKDKLIAWRKKQNIAEETLIQTLKNKSVRNFLYISLVLPELAKPDGIYKDASLKELPQGLNKHYDRHWVLMGMNREPPPIDRLRIICVICQQRDASSCEQIAFQAGEEEPKVQLILNGWMQFLEQPKKYHLLRYKFYHESYKDFVFSKNEVQSACGDPIDTDKRILENIVPPDVCF
ncbi:ATP-binding protein [Nostoc sp. ChiQUE01b]|uniref:ATP-binding protein n=1 Tax=Nostoc sp. ChiQUE01b TaxID=3075376 RepID=UPI002AD53F05|nr:ATP-binding protein [Nostoc sp. ChiQUE01b]MDZ8260603.1 ATP-binding protein [Nostoc sp. ChiQUE01b]